MPPTYDSSTVLTEAHAETLPEALQQRLEARIQAFHSRMDVHLHDTQRRYKSYYDRRVC